MNAVALLAIVSATEASAATPESLAGVLERYNGLANEAIPTLEQKELEELASGELVRIRHKFDDPELPQQVIGLLIVPGSKEEIWVSTHDDHYTYVDEIVSCFAGSNGTHDLWYQHLDAPWPFTDRHWIIEVFDNTKMLDATGGKMWEHNWRLPEGGEELAYELVATGQVPEIAARMNGKAIYTPVNHGAWLAIDLGDKTTLFGYHVTSVVGGGVPDGLIARYSMHSLKKVFSEAVDRLPEIREHYSAAHDPIKGGHGRYIAPFAEVAEAPDTDKID